MNLMLSIQHSTSLESSSGFYQTCIFTFSPDLAIEILFFDLARIQLLDPLHHLPSRYLFKRGRDESLDFSA